MIVDAGGLDTRFVREVAEIQAAIPMRFMAGEFDDLPDAVKKEVQAFADVNVASLSVVLSAAAVVGAEESEDRARAIFAAVAGAQLMARSRSDIALYDAWIESYRVARLLPA
jgi:TetR/AcrR family transcriptional repressor of nem operon